MFEQTFLEKRRRNPWATLLSFAIDSVLVGTLVLLPLLSTGAVPRIMRGIDIGPPPGPEPAPATQTRVEQTRSTQPRLESELDNGVLRLPTRIPREVAEVSDPLPEEAPGLSSGPIVPGSIPGTGTGRWNPGIIGIPGNGSIYVQPPPPVEPKAPARVAVISSLQQARALFQPEPVYPYIARNARVSGRVRLAAVISEQGTIEELRVLDGHPLLVQAALGAVRQWRYRPLLLGGRPTKVDTTIDVYFTLR